MITPSRSLLLFALTILLREPLYSQTSMQAKPITVDASASILPPETGYLRMGGVSSNGHSLQVNSRYLVLDGKPWFPVMGELHYTRVPESEWEDEILKMKAAGVNIISTYVFWIHHEEIEGQFDWTGRRDLRHFVELCAEHGMYVWLRPGPWAHGEVRNGGFPDWLAKQPNLRTNDPVYIAHVARFYNEIGLQLRGQMFKDGGPIIGAQLENEYGLHGPGRGAEHILQLKELAIKSGISPPLFSVTGWPSLDFPAREVIPISGGYPDGFWFGSQTQLPPSVNYLFNFNRELGDMGATVASEDPTGKVNLKHDPYFAAEEAGGMATAYHRRPVLSADDIAALTLTGIGSGINLYGYYMFHGGQNPEGKLSTLQESVATGYPNDLPEVNYDFQAPLGAFGQETESYRKTRLLHLFLNAYGSELAPMPAFAPAVHTRDAADTNAARVAVRSDGTSGYVFVNNYIRQTEMPSRPRFQIEVVLPTGKINIPSKPIDLPADSFFAWPFNLALGGARLQYSTAQLLTRLDTPKGKLVLFYAVPSLPVEFAFDAATVKTVSANCAKVVHANGSMTLSKVKPGMNSIVEVTDLSGIRTTIMILTQQEAEQVSMISAGGAKHLVLSASNILFNGKQMRLQSVSPTQDFAVLPNLHIESSSGRQAGLWTTYKVTQPEKHPTLDVMQIQQPTPRTAMDMGPLVDWRKTAVPTVPPDSSFKNAAVWELRCKNLDMSGLSNILLQIDYTGDIGRLTGSTGTSVFSIDDNFFNGLPWQIGLKEFGRMTDTPLTLSILPMPAVSPIYVDTHAHALLDANKMNPMLIDTKLIPEYESVVTVTPE